MASKRNLSLKKRSKDFSKHSKISNQACSQHAINLKQVGRSHTLKIIIVFENMGIMNLSEEEFEQ